MAGNRGDILNGVTIMFTVLIWITVPLRVYTRTFIRKSFGWDDSFAVVAFVRLGTTRLLTAGH